MKQFQSIQYLRAAAALGVVAFHTHMTGPLGQIGVDVFFVISGFIMWLVIQRESRPGDFLLRRVLRIWPLYAFATLVMAVHNSAPVHEVIKSLLFVPYRDAAGQAWPVLVQGWTLNYEMFFYLVLALCLFLPKARQLPAMTGVMTLLVATGLILRPTGAVAATFTGPLLLEFVAGLWLGWLAAAGRLPRTAVSLGLVALAVVGMALTRDFGGDERWRALIWGPSAVLLVAGALGLEQGGRVRTWAPLLALGNASYSIYLFHPFVLKTVVRHAAFLPTPLVVLVVMAVCSAVGLVAYFVVEKPLTQLFHRLLKKGRRGGAVPAGSAS